MEEKNVLKNKKGQFKGNYLLFCISRLISDIGTSVFNFSLSLYILDITGSASLFATVLSLGFIPGIIINTFGGVLIDRSNKKYVVVACDILSGALVLLFGILFSSNQENILMFAIFSFSLGAIQAVFTLALTASIPNIATKEDVPRLNSAFQGLGALVRIAGPMLGAIIYKMVGMQLIIVLDGFSFILSGVLEIFLVYKANDIINQEKKTYVEQLKDVYRFMNSRIGFKLLLFTSLINQMVFSSLTMVVLPFVVYNELDLSGFQLSQIMAGAYIGMIIGMVIISVTNKSTELFKKMLLFFKLEIGLSLIWIFPLIPIFSNVSKLGITIVYGISMLLIGVFVGFVNIPTLSYIQISTPDGLRASIIGVVNSVSQIAMPVGMWIYGLALENFSWGYIVSVPTIILIIVISIIGMNRNLKEFFRTA